MKDVSNTIQRDLKQDDLILIAGAGGFIGGSLVRYFHDLGYTRIRAVDKKPLSNWYQRIPGVENLCLDLSASDACARVVENAVEVYNLAADMGGMGFIERFRVECMRSSLINTHLLEAAYQAGVNRFFFSSSACFARVVLPFDPAIGVGQAIFKRRGGFPAKDLFDECVVAVASCHASGRAEIVFTVELHTTDLFRETNQIIHRDQFAGT